MMNSKDPSVLFETVMTAGTSGSNIGFTSGAYGSLSNNSISPQISRLRSGGLTGFLRFESTRPTLSLIKVNGIEYALIPGGDSRDYIWEGMPSFVDGESYSIQLIQAI